MLLRRIARPDVRLQEVRHFLGHWQCFLNKASFHKFRILCGQLLRLKKQLTTKVYNKLACSTFVFVLKVQTIFG